MAVFTDDQGYGRPGRIAAAGQYALLKAIESGKVTFWVLNGQDMTIQGPPGG